MKKRKADEGIGDQGSPMTPSRGNAHGTVKTNPPESKGTGKDGVTMKTSNETKIGRLKYRINFRRELIDSSERMIERHKSFIKNYKEQIKALSREVAAEMAKDAMKGAVSYAA